MFYTAETDIANEYNLKCTLDSLPIGSYCETMF